MSFKNAPCFISLRCDLLHQFYPQKIICKCDTTIKDLMDLIENKFTLLPGYFMNNNILLDSDVIVINLKKLNAPINLMYVPIYNNNNFIVNIN